MSLPAPQLACMTLAPDEPAAGDFKFIVTFLELEPPHQVAGHTRPPPEWVLCRGVGTASQQNERFRLDLDTQKMIKVLSALLNQRLV